MLKHNQKPSGGGLGAASQFSRVHRQLMLESEMHFDQGIVIKLQKGKEDDKALLKIKEQYLPCPALLWMVEASPFSSDPRS